MTTKTPSKTGRRVRLWVDRTALFVAAVLIWQGLSGTVINTFWISSPVLVAERLWQLAVSGALVWHASATVWQALLGLLLGMVVGVVVGLALHVLPRLAEAADPYIMGLYSLPRIALAPLFILYFGIGLLSKVMMAFSFVVFIFLLNTMQGLREVDQDQIDMMRSMRASRLYIARKLQLPSMLPWLFSAARISVGLALIGSVLGELLGANRGLGWYIEHASGRLDTTGLFAGLAALMVVAVLLNQVVNILERWAMPVR
ncbi:ABC transporter permease [Acuticoccus mangrovi]|uniref:ABC transporter permease n=1 Tax=Acuticoccus mangrovi TaxID=2796142 RepID=A0A934IN91_9HYPH|nr:ABC transporter permease [Acuticoccus mangrovi]MBJ3776987.1 ABC transporter permease [Acuticoccus mangrovi]